MCLQECWSKRERLEDELGSRSDRSKSGDVTCFSARMCLSRIFALLKSSIESKFNTVTSITVRVVMIGLSAVRQVQGSSCANCVSTTSTAAPVLCLTGWGLLCIWLWLLSLPAFQMCFSSFLWNYSLSLFYLFFLPEWSESGLLCCLKLSIIIINENDRTQAIK